MEMILGIGIAESVEVTVGIILRQLRTLAPSIKHTKANVFAFKARE